MNPLFVLANGIIGFILIAIGGIFFHMKKVRGLHKEIANLSEVTVLMGTVIKMGISDNMLAEILSEVPRFDDPNCKEALEAIQQKQIREQIEHQMVREAKLRERAERVWEVEEARRLNALRAAASVSTTPPEIILSLNNPNTPSTQGASS